FVGQGMVRHNQTSKIAVKGLAEREVPASMAIWTLSYSASGDQLPDLNVKLGENATAVKEFLKTAGFDDADIALQPPSIRDHSMETRDKDAQAPAARFSASQSVLLRTQKIQSVKPAVSTTGSLMQKGVLLQSISDPRFYFEDLNSIKPGMIEEATKNARVAGEQFARDSQTELGKLLNATQGRFQIDDRDAATPERKIVRVIVDVEYAIN
ncbi:SIMPL domain-containing protein, partial [Brevifollis gellanilyticus]|uniref:SIMPL domain-containing protein n=1 Tax=Brevifollis gellanilyticus TaxID=748831 RepID=UPI0011BFE041